MRDVTIKLPTSQAVAKGKVDVTKTFKLSMRHDLSVFIRSQMMPAVPRTSKQAHAYKRGVKSLHHDSSMWRFSENHFQVLWLIVSTRLELRMMYLGFVLGPSDRSYKSDVPLSDHQRRTEVQSHGKIHNGFKTNVEDETELFDAETLGYC